VLVALTGYGQAEDVRRSREAGFDHHLVKPADPEAVKELLSSVSREQETILPSPPEGERGRG
jgi:CheY-like chemotaxis protein